MGFHIFAAEHQRAFALLRNSRQRRSTGPSIRRAEAKTLSMAKRALTTPGHLYTTHLQDCMRTRHTHTRARTYLTSPSLVRKRRLDASHCPPVSDISSDL